MPGHTGAGLVSDAVKMPRPESAPFPAGIRSDNASDEVSVEEPPINKTFTDDAEDNDDRKE